MPTDVIMPQMGESIFEGTITKWLKKPGEKIQRDEPLFEISTDKVDAEIPAPASGVLKEIKVPEGSTVQVNSVVGVIDAEGAAVTTEAARPEPAQPAAPQASPERGQPVTPRAGEEEVEVPTYLRERAAVEPAAKTKEKEAVARQEEMVIEFPSEESGTSARVHSSPLVRRIAREQNIDLRQVPGTGLGGRVSKEDIQKFIEQRPAQKAAQPAQQPAYHPTAAAPAMPVSASAVLPGEIVAMSPMRKKIAERMVESKHTSAHVHSVFEVDMTRILNVRNKLKAGFEQRTGSKLTFMPFFCRAAIHGIQQFPIINSSVEGDNIHYHRNINLGIAVSLDWGLIVPVVKNAEERNFLGLQRSITDLAERARSKKLLPDEVQGGTFTITNPGSYGQMFGLPIILQPQVAIMGVGAIKKTPVVLTDENGTDSIAIRSICHLSLGYDHRIVDGAVADQFLAAVAKYLENWDEDIG